MRKFELTEKHIKLLTSAYITWYDCEFGAPAIDPKRPYGNSFVEGDIYEIIYGKEPPESFYDDDNARAELAELHRETETALQVVLSAKSFEPGLYKRDNSYTSVWYKA